MAGSRSDTATYHTEAVSQVVALMRARFDEPHPLREIAHTALMSPLHFHRVFQRTTMTTPYRFLTALRMSEAKRLLLQTTLSATDISVAVGYSSFGTFTTQFTRLVGLSPGRYRRHAHIWADARFTDLLAGPAIDAAAGAASGSVSARPDGTPGVAIIALYPSGVAARMPLACTVAAVPGPVRLPAPGLAGTFPILAASVGEQARLDEVLIGTASPGMYVGATRVTLPPGPATGPAARFHLQLRAPRLTDPPLLTAFPLLLDGFADAGATGRAL